MNRRESQDRCRQGAPRPKKQFYAMPGAAFRSAGPGTRTVEHYPQIILRNPERPANLHRIHLLHLPQHKKVRQRLRLIAFELASGCVRIPCEIPQQFTKFVPLVSEKSVRSIL